MRFYRWYVGGALGLLMALAPAVSANQHDWFASVYVGQYSKTALNEIIRFHTELEDSNVYVLSLGRQLGTLWKERIGMELEGQLGIHSGEQSHQEANLAFTLRWLPFPWDKIIDTSFAWGNGVSYATEKPPLEMREADDGDTSQWLYYILVEAAFKLPSRPQWELFVRIHHRSSCFGAIDGLFSASNFVGLGLRYHF